MATKENDTCRITADTRGQQRFTLIEQDVTAPATILEWIKLNMENPNISEEKLIEAFGCAMRMRKYGSRKWPD